MSKKFNEFIQGDSGDLSINRLTEIPNINSPQPPGDISTWFLGTRAENGAEFKELIGKAVDHIIEYRQTYLPDDPETITPEVKSSPEHRAGMGALTDAYNKLLEYLREYATPYFSMRYQGHVLWDTTLPGMLGYFATMLHNPNQLTIQMSTATTLLELLVGKDLCAMVGFPSNNEIEPWSHITAGGSIAIIEAVWATREMKFFPFAAREALKIEPALLKARNIEVPIVDGSHPKLLEATSWQLFNIRQDDILTLPQRIWDLCGESEELQDVYSVWDLLLKRSLNGRGWSAMSRTCFQDVGDLKMITSSTKHYTWPKAMASLGMGTDNEIDLYVDADARMDMKKLEEALAECLENRNPVLLTAAVLGSVEESAVDPLESILELRETYRKKGLEFNIHVDAAWGGYLMSMIRRDYKFAEQNSPLFIDDFSRVPCNEHTLRQLQRIRECDSATIDPHKMGYIPYPAGGNLYRNGQLKNLTIYAGSYIGATQSIRPQEPSVAIYGLEGSKPGARAAAVFLSHQVIRPSVSGYGKIVSQSMFNTKLFCLRLLLMATEQDNFIMVPLPRLKIEREGSNGDKESYLATLRSSLYGKTQDEILADPEAMAMFREIGCDENILCYAFNFKRQDGSINDDPELFFKLTDLVYDRFHVHYYEDGKAEDIHKYRFFLTSTIFQKSDYGPTFIENYAKRLGLSKTPDSIKVLRSIVMDPCVSDLPDGGSFFDEIIETLRSNVTEIIEQNFR
ncbi:pyridoxal-dependent decarboxylase [Microcoleus vaginatus GB2-A3]|uniref:pyridoxal phosphate-dependent decarboxylase family protein n=1 Tax=Microcoleus vaginatus TaxID=119532 RepID=UPI0032AB3C42